MLTAVSAFWFKKFAGVVPNHFLTTDTSWLPLELRNIPDLEGRGTVVRKATPLKVECIMRGYLYGSAIKEYNEEGTVSGIPLPPGLLKASKLPYPIFTPSTKAQTGHDENITFEKAVELIGDEGIADQVRELSIMLYKLAADYALERGIIIADTKFEFGLIDGKLVLIDEILTPDSSRFWPLASMGTGQGSGLLRQAVRSRLVAREP